MILNFNKEELEKLKNLAKLSITDSDLKNKLINSNWLLDKLENNKEQNDKLYLVTPNRYHYGDDYQMGFNRNNPLSTKVFINKEKAKQLLDMENKLYQEEYEIDDEEMEKLKKENDLEYGLKIIDINDNVEFKPIIDFYYNFRIKPNKEKNGTIITILTKYNPMYTVEKSFLNNKFQIEFYKGDKEIKDIVIRFKLEKTKDLNINKLENDLADMVNEIYYSILYDEIKKYYPEAIEGTELYTIFIDQNKYLK